ncbi:MAG: Tetratricopeptide repeat protein, partial [Bacteroidetes bacterium]|nr:Tetratricopeptide repeat protein [Bacteroidota bacterium]
MITALLGAVLFTPLIISSATLYPFQTGKGMAFRVLVEITAFLYGWLVLIEPRARPKPNKLLTGVNAYRSFWGDLERMEGAFGILHGIALFVILSGFLTSKEEWARFFGGSLLASFIVAWYALAQIYPALRLFPVVEPTSVQPGSTLGHQSFLATYAIFQIFFGLFIVLLQKSRAWRAFGVCGSVVNLVLLTVTAVRGAQVGFFVAGAVGIVLTAVYVVKNLKARVALCGALLVVIAFFGVLLSLKDSPHLKRFPYALQRMATISPDAAMARTRLIALRVSWEAFKERPVLGWGQENFKIAYNRHFDPEFLYYEAVWFDRAHNKIAEVIVQTGAMGLIAYVSILFFGLLGLMRFIRMRDSSTERLLAICVIMLGSAYFVQNLFLFDTPTSYLMFFSSLAFVVFLLNEDKRVADLKEWKKSRASGTTMVKSPWRMFLVGGGILTAFLIVYANWIPYTTARLGRTAYDANDPRQAM